MATGYGLNVSVDAVLLMNILHCEVLCISFLAWHSENEAPVEMLLQAAALLDSGGLIYATHWRHRFFLVKTSPLTTSLKTV